MPIRTYLVAALLAMSVSAAPAQTAGPTSTMPPEKPATSEITSCKAVALERLAAREPDIKDIYIDEDGATIATSDVKVEDTPITRIIMGEAYLRTDKSDKPRRFLCLIGEKGKVVLTFFTAR
jgi:hypothetical protein